MLQVLLAKQQEHAWREQVLKLQSSLENQRVDMQDVTSNMRRQYKVLMGFEQCYTPPNLQRLAQHSHSSSL